MKWERVGGGASVPGAGTRGVCMGIGTECKGVGDGAPTYGG
jgi:hypothetical protein